MAVEEIKGLSQLLANMRQLPAELVSKNGGPVRQGLYKAALLVKDRAVQLAPKRSGNMARNIVVYRDRDPQRSGANERYIIGVRKKRWTSKAKIRAKRNAKGKIDKYLNNDAYYWHFVELGTSKMKAEPFMRPGFEQTEQEQIEAFRTTVADGIQKIVASMKK